MTLRAEILSGIKWTAGAKLCAQAFTWVITLVVMRLLSPEDYGLLAMATVFVTFLLVMAEAGMGPALIQKEDLERPQLQQAFAVIIIVDLAMCAIVNLIAPAIASFFREPRLVEIVRALSLYFVVMIATTVPESMLARQLNFKALSLIDLVTAITSSLVTLTLAWLKQGVWALVLGNLSASVLRATLINVVAPVQVRPRVSLTGMRHMLKFGGNVTSARMLSFFLNQSDAVIVGRLLGSQLLGLYSVAMHLASLPVQRVSAILNQVTFPVVSRFQRQPRDVASFVVQSARALSVVAFPVLWGISSTAPELVQAFLGPHWADAALPLQLLALMMPLKMIVNFLPSASDALGRPDLGFRNVLIASVVMPPMFLVGSHWGIVGVASAWVIAYPVVMFFNTRRILRIVGLEIRDLIRAIGPSATCAAAMYVVVRAVTVPLEPLTGNTARLVLLVLVGVVVYSTLTLLLNRQGYRDVVSVLRKSAKA